MNSRLLSHFSSSSGDELRLEVIMIESPLQDFGVFRFTRDRFVVVDTESIVDRMIQFMCETEGCIRLMLV